MAIVAIAATVLAAAYLGRPRPVSLRPAAIAERGWSRDLNMNRIRRDIGVLSQLPSRLTGMPGARAGAERILSELSALPVTAVETQEFEVPVPVTAEAYLEATTAEGTVRLQLHPLWPNLARTCQTPPGGLSGPLVDVGTGREEELAGHSLRDAIVVLDWASNTEWLSIPEFGGKAVVFRANDEATGYTARNKFLSVPADTPRYYVAAEHVPLLDRLTAGPAPEVTIHCRSDWQRVTGTNILALVSEGAGAPGARGHEDLDLAPVVFHAYYDSISVVPSLAPGAEQACGAAALLELGRFFAGTTTKRPVVLLFTSGHGQALAGMLHFVGELRRQLELDTDPGDAGTLLARLGRPALFVGLDLSSRSEQFGIFALGRFRGQYEHKLRPKFSVLGSELAEYATTFLEHGAEESHHAGFVDCINLTRGRYWWTYFPYQAPFESEIPVLAGLPAVTLATVNDDRRVVDTPGDRPHRIRFDLLERQLLTRPGDGAGLAAIALALTEWRGPFVSSPLTDAWASLEGRVVWLDQERNYVPSEPLVGALVFLKTLRGDKHLMGTRGIPATMSDATGSFRFDGLVQITENWQFRNCQLEAYGSALPSFTEANPSAMKQYLNVLNRRQGTVRDVALDGTVLYAVDMARPQDYPSRIEIRKREQHLNLVCFPCSALTITGLTDPRGYLPLTDLSILEAATMASPFQFGHSLTDSLRGDDAENLVTLWADPTIRILITLGLGFQEKRLILINNTLDNPQGSGFVLDDLRTVPSMVLQGARDMWNLDESRIRKLERNGVSNPRIRQFHEQSGSLLEQAQHSLQSHDYRTYRNASEKSWALEGRAYGEVLSVINNMIRGVLFYLALLLPFSYCLERLLIASGTIKRRVLWICLIFSVCFAALAALHPAFRFTLTPFLVLLAFIIVALVVTVSVLIVARMDAVLQERKQARVGRHEEQLKVGGIAVRAVDLGISNIRRRPQRGFLTALTVVTVTFILLSFISLVPVVSISKLNHPEGRPTYRGLLARDRAWDPLPQPLYAAVRRNFGNSARPSETRTAEQPVVAARGWFFSDWGGKLSQIDVTPAPSVRGQGEETVAPAAASNRSFTAVALLCLEPSEPLITGVDGALLAGRWFTGADEAAAILPLHVAEQLGLGLDDPGARIRLFGQELPVVGIIDSTRFDAVRDIDGEPLTPVNFVLQQQLKAQQAGDDDEESDTLEEYIHYASDQIVILPFKFGHRLGATIRSIAVKAGAATDLDGEAEGYTKRSNLTILASDGASVTLYAALNTSQISAAWQIAVPLFLGFVMVLGTMLGSVYERRREIFVYNSVGLSPGSVAALFMAESSVYAVLGAGFGYLLGQGMARLLQLTDWLPGLTLNYTAGSTVLVTALTMGIVLVSTVYPARQAFHAAIPDVERESEQSLTGGHGEDTVQFFLPFVAAPSNVLAMQAYMHEYLNSIQGVTIGHLAVDNLEARVEECDGRRIPVLSFRAWLAPFDLGISHDVLLRIVYREQRGVYQYHLAARRFSGDHQNWRRLMPRFILAVRKQLLMWRVLTTADLAGYQAAGKERFADAAAEVDRAAVAAPGVAPSTGS